MGRMASRHCPQWSLLMLAVVVLPLMLRAEPSPVTDKDIELLQEVSEEIVCFSRTFEDLTCFWEEKGWNGVEDMYRFFYTDDEDTKECPLTVQRVPGGGGRYICVFPSMDVLLFIKMNIEVEDTIAKETRYSRKLQLEDVALIDPPRDIAATWTGQLGQIRVSWKAPDHEYSTWLIYEVQYRPVTSSEPPQTQTVNHADGALTCDLSDIKPGAQYHIWVRTRPNGKAFNGFWGPWSEVVSIVTPYNADNISLDCFTSDLVRESCEWKSASEEASSHVLYYQHRGLDWVRCVEPRTGLPTETSSHSCGFLATNDSWISVIVNVTTINKDVFTYYREPFWMYKTVRTDAPQNLSANVSDGQLRLNWAPPLARLDGQMSYEIRYSETNSSNWKALQVQHAAHSMTLDVRSGTPYSVQIRAIPNGKKFTGSWSAWSEVLTAAVPLDSGWIMYMAAATLLVFLTGALLLMRCTFSAIFSKLKRKIWPPVPNLHRVLDGFLAEIQKQYQPTPSFYEKQLEDTLLPCLLEILSEETQLPKGVEMAPETLLINVMPSVAWPLTPALPENPLQAETNILSSPQQDYVVLAPTISSNSRHENEYSNGAAAHNLSLGMFLLRVPGNETDSQQESQEPQNSEAEHYTTFPRPSQGQQVHSEQGTLWGISDLGEEGDWNHEAMNTTDIANQSYLLMNNWGQ